MFLVKQWDVSRLLMAWEVGRGGEELGNRPLGLKEAPLGKGGGAILGKLHFPVSLQKRGCKRCWGPNRDVGGMLFVAKAEHTQGILLWG